MAKRKGLNEKAERPVDSLFPPKKEEEKKKRDYPRATYYITEEMKESIRIIAFKEKKEISETVRDLFEKAIPEEIMDEAKENLKEEE